MDFDPERVTYEDLLEAFWVVHSPLRQARSQQYASLILVSDDEQREAALESKERIENRTCRSVFTDVRTLDRFYLAEDYHQKYALRADGKLMSEMARYYRSDELLRESTVAARLNGYAYGAGSKTRLEQEIELFGLSDEGIRHLRELVRNGR